MAGGSAGLYDPSLVNLGFPACAQNSGRCGRRICLPRKPKALFVVGSLCRLDLYLYTCVYMYIYIYAYAYTYMHTCMHTYVHLCVSLYWILLNQTRQTKTGGFWAHLGEVHWVVLSLGPEVHRKIRAPRGLRGLPEATVGLEEPQLTFIGPHIKYIVYSYIYYTIYYIYIVYSK